jgi:hypothetical protein
MSQCFPVGLRLLHSEFSSSYVSSRKGIYLLGKAIQREIPTSTNNVTWEMIHPSALRQQPLEPQELKKVIERNPGIVTQLLPLEVRIIQTWPIQPKSEEGSRRDYARKLAVHVGQKVGQKLKEKVKS